MTELPHWAIWIAVIGYPVVGLISGFLGAHLSRKGTKEADERGRREELMRQVRWAAELVVCEDPRRAQLGADQLAALERSTLFTEADKVFIDAAMRSALQGPIAAIEAGRKAGMEVDVVQLSLDTGVGLGVGSPDGEEEGDDH